MSLVSPRNSINPARRKDGWTQWRPWEPTTEGFVLHHLLFQSDRAPHLFITEHFPSSLPAASKVESQMEVVPLRSRLYWVPAVCQPVPRLQAQSSPWAESCWSASPLLPYPCQLGTSFAVMLRLFSLLRALSPYDDYNSRCKFLIPFPR